MAFSLQVTLSKEKVKLLVVIEGPTASGKTSLSVELAIALDTIVLSADSRQFYREMRIGTARPLEVELKGVRHYFLGSHSIHDELTAGKFATESEKILQSEFDSHPIIILTGGSGMYVDALCKGLDQVPVSSEQRSKLTMEWQSNGLQALLEELKQKDPEHYATIDQDNPMRVIRALEAIRSSGKSLTSFLGQQRKARPFEVIRFRIEHPRTELYDRINQRVDQMMEQGLLNEVRSLYEFKGLNALKTVGYSELFDYLDGKTDLTKAVDLIKQHSRNYAKRQETWLKRNQESIALPFSTVEDMKKRVLHELKMRNYWIS